MTTDRLFFTPDQLEWPNLCLTKCLDHVCNKSVELVEVHFDWSHWKLIPLLTVSAYIASLSVLCPIRPRVTCISLKGSDFHHAKNRNWSAQWKVAWATDYISSTWISVNQLIISPSWRPSAWRHSRSAALHWERPRGETPDLSTKQIFLQVLKTPSSLRSPFKSAFVFATSLCKVTSLRRNKALHYLRCSMAQRTHNKNLFCLYLFLIFLIRFFLFFYTHVKTRHTLNPILKTCW